MTSYCSENPNGLILRVFRLLGDKKELIDFFHCMVVESTHCKDMTPVRLSVTF